MNSIPDSIRETCDLCDGSGRLGLGSVCPRCNGSGFQIRSRYEPKSAVGLYDDDDVRVRELEKALADEIAKRLELERENQTLRLLNNDLRADVKRLVRGP